MSASLSNDSSSAELIAIVAMTPAGVIGKDGDMPWRLSSDLRRFKKLTVGGTLIMGRKTYESIGRPLPGRRTIVITRNADWSADGVECARSPDEAIEMARRGSGFPGTLPPDEGKASGQGIQTARFDRGIFVVGGAQIYRCLLSRCDQVLLTRVLSDVQGDTLVELDLSQYEVMDLERVPAGPVDDVPTEFMRLRPKNKF